MSDSIRDGSSLTPGQLLAAAREARSLSQEDIAKRTRLAVHLVDDLEHNEYSHIGARTFVRGYLCSYARLVGIPEKQILDALESSGLMPEVPDLVAPMRIEGKPMVDAPVDRTLPNISFSKTMWAGAALVVVVAGAFIFQSDKGDLLKKAEAKTQTVASAASASLSFAQQPANSDDNSASVKPAAAHATKTQQQPVTMNADDNSAQPGIVAQADMPATPAPTVSPAVNTTVHPAKPAFKRIKRHPEANSFDVSNNDAGLHPTYVVSPVDVKTEK